MHKKVNFERTLPQKENREQKELPQHLREPMKGTRVALDSKLYCNTRKTLEVVEKIEAEVSTKKSRKQLSTTEQAF